MITRSARRECFRKSQGFFNIKASPYTPEDVVQFAGKRKKFVRISIEAAAVPVCRRVKAKYSNVRRQCYFGNCNPHRKQMKNDKTVLVTGSCGLIGSEVVRFFAG